MGNCLDLRLLYYYRNNNSQVLNTVPILNRRCWEYVFRQKGCSNFPNHYIIKPFPSPPSGDHRLKMGNLNKPAVSPGF